MTERSRRVEYDSMRKEGTALRTKELQEGNRGDTAPRRQLILLVKSITNQQSFLF